MTVLYAPTKALLEPNLLVPKKKPVGKVVVDRSNPMSRDYADGSLFQNGMLERLEYDTKREAGAPELTYGVKSGSLSIGTLGGQRALITATSAVEDNIFGFSTTNFYEWSEANGYASGGSEGQLRNLTLATTFYHNARTSGDEQGIIECGSAGGTSGLYAYLVGSSPWLLKVAIGHWSSSVFASETPPLKKWNTLVIAINGSPEATVFLNGKNLGSTSVGRLVIAQNLHFGTCFGGLYANSLDGGIGSWMYFRRGLSDAEAKSLSVDPYQFLKPAGIETEITSVGKGGAIAEVWHRMMSWL